MTEKCPIIYAFVLLALSLFIPNPDLSAQSEGYDWETLPVWDNDKFYYRVTVDSEGIYWIIDSGYRIHTFDPVTELYESHSENIKDAFGWSTLISYKITEKSPDEMWVSTNHGAVVISEGEFMHYSDGLGIPNMEWSMVNPVTGDIWSTHGLSGISFFSDGVFSDFEALDELEIPSLNVDRLWFEDDGSLWFTAWDEGVFQYVDGIFKQYTEENGLDCVLGGNCTCWSFTEDQYDSQWLVLAYSGLQRFSSTGEWSYYSESTGHLPNDKISKVIFFDNDIWFVAAPNLADDSVLHGLFKMDIETYEVTHYDSENTPILSNDIWDIHVDPQGRLCVVAEEGITVLTPWPTAVSPIADNELAIEVFPNPVSDILNISVGETMGKTNYELLDISGRRLLAGSFENTTAAKIDMGHLTKGVYVLVLRSGDEAPPSYHKIHKD